MDEERKLEIGLREETVGNKRKKKNCFSKVYSHLIFCLNNNTHPNMLYYTNPEKTEFEVVLLNQKNKNWSEENISLCKDLDRISKRGYDEKNPNYAEKTRGRLRSNLSKLQGKTGDCKRLEEIPQEIPQTDKSRKILKFRILIKIHGENQLVNSAVNKKVVQKRGNKNRKRISETPGGPSPSKMMKTTSPLVLPVNEVQNIGANPLNGLSTIYVLQIENPDLNISLGLTYVQNADSDASTFNGSNTGNSDNSNGEISEESPYDRASLQNTSSDVSTFNGSNTRNSDNSNVEISEQSPYDWASLQNTSSDVSTFNGSNTRNSDNSNVEISEETPYDWASMQNTSIDVSTFNGSNTRNSDNSNVETSEELPYDWAFLQNTSSDLSTFNGSNTRNSYNPNREISEELPYLWAPLQNTNSEVSTFNGSNTRNSDNYSFVNLNANSPGSSSSGSFQENNEHFEGTTIFRMLENYELDLNNITFFDDEEKLVDSTNPLLSSVAEPERDLLFSSTAEQERDTVSLFDLDSFGDIDDVIRKDS